MRSKSLLFFLLCPLIVVGQTWVRNTSLPVEAIGPLAGHHLMVWPSHGLFFDEVQGTWRFQRPPLYATREDLLTETVVCRYLLPMLEGAGAYVYVPRERDWSGERAIVDNNGGLARGFYGEKNGEQTWEEAGVGYALTSDTLAEGYNPFREGTARRVRSVVAGHTLSVAGWRPEMKGKSRRAVYVSYKSVEGSVDDAHYTVVHQGVPTHFLVDQTMGGSTWVYLGTFDFEGGDPLNNCVLLTNESHRQGWVTADGVRFGAEKGAWSLGARYYLQSAGLPQSVYHHFASHYTDDYTCRPHAANYFSGGSRMNPYETGLGVPLEMTLGLHSDAGYTEADTIVGSLSIHTSRTRDSLTHYPTGVDRMKAAELCKAMLDGITRDLTYHFGGWTWRELRDADYAETRIPQMPAAIIETLSHQNFADMRLAHNPAFKFCLSRAIYKAIARFLNPDAVPAPLPVKNFAATASTKGQSVRLTWEPRRDPLEPKAKARGYIIYMAAGDKGWDNGTYTRETEYKATGLTAGLCYRFKVAAVGEGGISLESEELAARVGTRGGKNLLVVNAFRRVSAPDTLSTETACGFLLDDDPGVSWGPTTEYCGRQLAFTRSTIGREDPLGLGFSSDETTGRVLGGNTFDYPTLHVRTLSRRADIDATISSTSLEALNEGTVKAKDYDMLDVIGGASKDVAQHFAISPLPMLLSGAYVATPWRADSIALVLGEDYHTYEVNMRPNETTYHTRRLSYFELENDDKVLLRYDQDFRPAAIERIDGESHKIIVGFPLELITDERERENLLYELIHKLLY